MSRHAAKTGAQAKDVVRVPRVAGMRCIQTWMAELEVMYSESSGLIAGALEDEQRLDNRVIEGHLLIEHFWMIVSTGTRRHEEDHEKQGSPPRESAKAMGIPANIQPASRRR